MSQLWVRLTPGAAADRIDGRATDADGQVFLKARVRAVAENNEANKALTAMIAKAFGVAKAKVTVLRGHAARRKTLDIAGAREADIAAFIAKFEERP